MVEVITSDPLETDALELQFDGLFEPATGTVGLKDETKPSAWRAFWLSAKRENLTASGVEFLGDAMDRDGVEGVDPNFNPYAYIRDNWEPADLEDFKPEIERGLFDGMTSPEQVALRRLELLRRREELVVLSEGSGTAVFLGAIAGALTDPVSYTPFGWVNRIRGAGRVAKGVLAGVQSAAIPEIGLQAIQPYRTAEESFLNVGIGGVFGGAIGAFSRLVHPTHPGAPRRGNIFDIGVDHGAAVRTPDGAIDVFTPAPFTAKGAGGSVGAAAVREFTVAPNRLKGIFDNVPGANRFFKWAQMRTPVGRIVHALSDRWREEGMRFADVGGIIFDSFRRGEAAPPSAEAITQEYLSQTLDRVFSRVEQITYKLNDQLGSSRILLTFDAGRRIPDERIMEIVKGRLTKTENPDKIAALQGKYGDAWPHISAAADEIVGEVHAANKFMENRLLEHGILRSESREASAQARVDQLEKELEAAVEAAKQARAAKGAKKGAKREVAAHEQRSELEIEADLREAKAALAHERAKPEPMGEDYGHAQMYNAINVRHDEAGFKAWVRDILRSQPPDELLAALNIKRADYEKLGRESVEIAGQRYNLEQGLELKREIQAEWAGSDTQFKLSQANDRLVSARQAADDAEKDLVSALDDLKLLDRETQKTSGDRIRMTRDLMNKRVEATRDAVEKARREVELAEAEAKKLETLGTPEAPAAPAAVVAPVKSIKAEELRGNLARLRSELSDLNSRKPSEADRLLGRKSPKGLAEAIRSKKKVIKNVEGNLAKAEQAERILAKRKPAKPVKAPEPVSKEKRDKWLAWADKREAEHTAELQKLSKARHRATGMKKADIDRQVNVLRAKVARIVKKRKAFEAEAAAEKPVKKATPEQIGRAKERVRLAKRELQRAEGHHARTLQRVDELEARASDLEERRAQVLEAREVARRAKSAANKAARKAKGQVKRLETHIKRLQNVERSDLPDLESVVNEVFEGVSSHHILPHGVLDQIVPDTGRFKARRLIMTPEQKAFGERTGYLQTDLAMILQSQYDQISRHLGYREALGIGEFEGARFTSWDKYKAHVLDDYEEQMAIAKAKGDTQLAKRIEVEKVQTEKDMNGLKDRLLGTEYKGDPDAWAPWLGQKVRDANFLRYGAGFLLPSLTDVASVALANGPLGRLLTNHMRDAMKIMRKLQQENPTDFELFLYAVEHGPHANRTMRLLGADEVSQRLGRGVQGTATHTLTKGIDTGSNVLKRMVSRYSGLNYWNRAWKVMTGLNYAHKMMDLLPKYASLGEKEIGDLASIGIGRVEAQRLAKYLEKYGTKGENGRVDPHFELWTGAEARLAERDMRMAIRRAQDRAIFTPGVGDTPLLMSTTGGKIWLQFQTFAFAFMNRFMAPISQKFVNGQHAQALAAWGHLAWSSLLVMVGKAFQRGESDEEIAAMFSEEKLASTMFDALDRSGYMAFFSPYVDAAIKVTGGDGGLQDKVFGGHVGPSSRFQRNRWWESFAGASFGLGRDSAELFAAALDGDWNKTVKKAARLAPFNFYWKLMHATADRFE